MSENMVVISKNYLTFLEKRDEELKQLEANGVDNWSGYGCMCYENGENECVFCRED